MRKKKKVLVKRTLAQFTYRSVDLEAPSLRLIFYTAARRTRSCYGCYGYYGSKRNGDVTCLRSPVCSQYVARLHKTLKQASNATIHRNCKYNNTCETCQSGKKINSTGLNIDRKVLFGCDHKSDGNLTLNM